MKVALYDVKGFAFLRHESEEAAPPQDAILVGTAELSEEGLAILLDRLRGQLFQEEVGGRA